MSNVPPTAPDLVIDTTGDIWNAGTASDGVLKLTRGWGATLKVRFAVFGREPTVHGFDRYGLRPATAAETARYDATV